MAVAVHRQAPSGRASASGRRRIALLLAASATTECLLIAGVTLPMRIDRHPPSLATNLAGVYGTDVRGLLLYGALAAGLFAAYAIAVAAARTLSRRMMPVAVGLTALFGVTLLPAHPIYSSDVFHYVATARVAFTHGENPLTTAPEQIAGDPLMVLSGWKSLPSPYGALWTWVSGAPYLLSGEAADATRAVVWFKALTVLGTVAAAAAIGLAAERLRPGAGAVAVVLFGWNPVVLLHVIGDGHNDALMAALMAGGLLALAYGRPALAIALTGGAALVKAAAVPAVAMLSVWLARTGRWRAVLAGLAVAVAVGAVTYAPYWAGTETFAAAMDEGRYFSGTPASLVVRALSPALGEDRAMLIVSVALRAGLLAAAVWLLSRVEQTAAGGIAAIAGVYVLAVTVLGGWYQPWYAVWPLTYLAVLASNSAARMIAFALTGAALLIPIATNFAPAIGGWDVNGAAIDSLAVTLGVLPFMPAGWSIIQVERRSKRRAATGAGVPEPKGNT